MRALGRLAINQEYATAIARYVIIRVMHPRVGRGCGVWWWWWRGQYLLHETALYALDALLRIYVYADTSLQLSKRLVSACVFSGEGGVREMVKSIQESKEFDDSATDSVQLLVHISPTFRVII